MELFVKFVDPHVLLLGGVELGEDVVDLIDDSLVLLAKLSISIGYFVVLVAQCIGYIKRVVRTEPVAVIF